MDNNGTTYQNGRFVDVDEVHNNTKNMTLSGFNQEGGKVTGNIQNLSIESKQNTSTTKGSTIGGSLSIAPNGMPLGSASYSQTNGERRVVDSPTTFIIGDGSNLKVGKVENTAGAIGATGSGKLSIDEYVGHNLENIDKLKTVGGSVGVSASGINSIGVNYSDRKQEGITKNTVIGNVEIGKSSGDEINKDLGSMTEITKDRDFKTDINIESQTIKYALNPSQFKEDLQIALIEGKATGRTVVKTIDNMINGDKSQDIGDAEKRSLIEIKEAIVRVQTAPAMDIIEEKDFPEYIKAKGNEYTLAGNYKDAMIPPKNQREKIDKVIFKDIKNFYYGTKTLDEKISESNGKLYGSLIGSTFGVITATYTIDNLSKVLDSTLKGGNISSISKISYKTENTSLALYDKSKTLPVPVATNGTLAPSLTINRALATVPLLTDGANKVSQVQNNRLALENTLIWNKITPVYPDISPTFIPRAFIIESNGKKFFVTLNATKHIAEDFTKKHYLADGSDINYALKNQILLKGFWAALDQITNFEIQYGKKYYTDNWEIMINKRSTKKYPAIYHGVIREGVKK